MRSLVRTKHKVDVVWIHAWCISCFRWGKFLKEWLDIIKLKYFENFHIFFVFSHFYRAKFFVSLIQIFCLMLSCPNIFKIIEIFLTILRPYQVFNVFYHKSWWNRFEKTFLTWLRANLNSFVTWEAKISGFEVWGKN